MPSAVSWQALHYYLTVLTLLDQLDLKEFNWQQVSVILQHELLFTLPDRFYILFDGTKLNMESTRIVSKFLMDRDRAGSLWVKSHRYAGLAMCTLEILRDKWVYNPYTLVRANTNAWIYSRRFIDIVDIHTLIPTNLFGTTYYEVGKLAFDLLPILLSRVTGPGVSQVNNILLRLPTFYLIKDDPLGSEKVKAMQAIEEFKLKVWF